jgi:chemotaxis protein MotB
MAERKKKCPAPGYGTPAWMTTFGDMNNLLLVFFIAMLTDAEVDGREMRLILSPFEQNMGQLSGGNTLSPGPLSEGGNTIEALPSREIGSRLAKSLKDVSEMLKPELKSRRVRIDETQKGYKISLASDLFFRPGSAEIDYDEGKETLRKLALTLRELNDKAKIEVIGHTDSDTLSKQSTTSRFFPSNWELSTARACTVVRYITTFGVSPDHTFASGRAEFEPLESNNSPEGRAYNRRVDIYISPLSAQ